MREFDYSKLLNLNIPANMYDLISKIYEYKGKQELYVANFSDVLEKMVEVAKIQSTKSSNAIEGISTNDSRLEELMKRKYTGIGKCWILSTKIIRILTLRKIIS